MYESGKSLKKRKLSEYRDPDYEQKNETNTKTTTNTATACENFSKLQKTTENENASTSGALTYTAAAAATQFADSPKYPSTENSRLQRTREIIAREFQREINHHKKELEEVDKSIEEAIKIFDKLRYTLVKNYYQKQEVEISTKEAAQLRGENTLLDNEAIGPQLPLHPSVKQIIGKRPSSLADVLRMHPKRTAAQNAQQKIDEVTNSLSNKQKRREERRLQKIIRDRGIVIDHSKSSTDNQQHTFDLEQAKLLSQVVTMEQSKPQASIPQVPVASKPLNATRLNNKVKHLIVVGNTSQYIGDENMTSTNTSAMAGQRISHKWLVYVQAKNPASTPLERLVEKIRFFLHASYRPNDVVDIVSPPFQLSRRGWGEFPVRLQIYFNENLQQKPVQFVHNLILDKTLSGQQTMGAETLVEVWLRPLPKLNYNNKYNASIAASTILDATYNKSNYNTASNDDDDDEEKIYNKRTYSLGLGEMKDDLDDDNIFDFLNRIEATPSSFGSDIEQIEPTISLNDSFTSIVTSPTKLFFGNITPEKNKSPIKNINNTNTLVGTKTAFIATSITENVNNDSPTTTTITTTRIFTSVTATATKTKPIKINENILGSKPKQSAPPSSSSSSLSSKTTTTRKPISTPITSTNTTSISSPFSTLKTTRFSTLKPYPQPATPKPSIICLNTFNDTATTPTATTTLSSSIRVSTAQLNANNRQVLLQKNAKIIHFMKPNNETKTQQTQNTTTIAAAGAVKPVQTYEKKLVQLVDAQGKIKYVQMLVAQKQISTNIISNNNNNNINVAIKNAATTTTTTIGKIIPNINFINGNKVQNTFTTTTTTTKTTPTTTKLTNQFPKNTPNIFLKEGKLYVRDPQQMKFKQQQKQQTSLLKPQVSLLKQQAPLPLKPTENDHDYAPKLRVTTKPITSTQPAIIKLNLIKSTKNNFIFNQNNFIIRATKVLQDEEEQLYKCERLKLEESFQRLKFSSMRAAIEFLLRRLPLIATNNCQLLKDFVFVRCRSELAFQQLNAFTQRSCEWLRAKYIAECLRKHDQLKQLLQNNDIEVYWTTREIVLFARYHAYTPPIKSLSVQEAVKATAKSRKYEEILRKKVSLEQEQVQYETLTSNEPISSWMEDVTTKFKMEEITTKNELEIDVISVENTLAANSSKSSASSDSATAVKNNSDGCALSVPSHLETAAELVQEICSSLNVNLQAEEVSENTRQPLAKIVMAQCVRVFLEQLVRRAVATRLQQSQHQQLTDCDLPTVRLQDIGKALVEFGQPAEETGKNYVYSEYDFLTNCYLGVPQLDNESDDEHA